MDAHPLDPDDVRPLYGDDSAHDFDHALRVLTTAERIGRAEGADRAVVRTAALLHDVARADERAGLGEHAALGAERARALLADRAPAFVDAVCHAIEAHRFRVALPPRTLEAQVVHDADKLDAIGAIGVARAFAFGGALGRPLWADDAAGVHTAVQEYRVKLVHLRDRLCTATARAMADDRHTWMVRFFERFEAEIAGRR